jgi:hypothetical protein
MKGNTMHDETPARKHLPVAEARDALKHITVSSEFDNLDALDLLHGYVLLRASKSFHGVSERYANALAHKVRKADLTAIKADELSYSTQTGFGDEWVPDLWSAQIWHKARLENVILPLFRAVEMPSNPFELPIEGRNIRNCISLWGQISAICLIPPPSHWPISYPDNFPIFNNELFFPHQTVQQLIDSALT